MFASFLARLPHEPQTSHPTCFDDALKRLADIMHDPAICTRDPCSPMAFSCVPAALVRWRMQIYAQAATGQREAFSPLDRSGRPTRRYVATRWSSVVVHLWWPSQLRYSDRLQEQWFEVDRNCMSYSGVCRYSRPFFVGVFRNLKKIFTFSTIGGSGNTQEAGDI